MILNLHLGVATDGTLVAAAVDIAEDLGFALEDDGGVTIDGALVAATVDVAGTPHKIVASIECTHLGVSLEGEGGSVNRAEVGFFNILSSDYLCSVKTCTAVRRIILYMLPCVVCCTRKDSRLEHTRRAIVIRIGCKSRIPDGDGGQGGGIAGTEDVAVDGAVVEYRDGSTSHLAKAAAAVKVLVDSAARQHGIHVVALRQRKGDELHK